MPSFPDSAVLILLVLILFGPKKLPELARQFGKLMNDFRRASNEFRTQMEEELRISEQADRQKRITAEAVVPAAPALDPAPASEPTYADQGLPPHDPLQDYPSDYPVDTGDSPHESSYDSLPQAVPESSLDSTPESFPDSTPEASPAPLPIATSGELSILPPSTGLPTPNSEPAQLPEDPVPAHQSAAETEALHS
jgi:sec-independent protein translocase protein TatB